MKISGRFFGIATILTSCTLGLEAQVFNDFEGGTPGAQYGFRLPRFSGSTQPNLATTPDVHAVVAGFGSNPTQVGQFDFAFLDASMDRWVRLTTFNATGVPNPVVDLNQVLQFDIYSANDIELAVGIREQADVNGPVGANGGSSGPIEWVGAERATSSATIAPGGKLILGGAWQTVSFNLKGEPTFAFTGNGMLEGDWGTLESLAISSLGSAAQTIYVDNFQIVPEPGTVGLLALGCALLGLARLRRSR